MYRIFSFYYLNLTMFLGLGGALGQLRRAFILTWDQIAILHFKHCIVSTCQWNFNPRSVGEKKLKKSWQASFYLTVLCPSPWAQGLCEELISKVTEWVYRCFLTKIIMIGPEVLNAWLALNVRYTVRALNTWRLPKTNTLWYLTLLKIWV